MGSVYVLPGAEALAEPGGWNGTPATHAAADARFIAAVVARWPLDRVLRADAGKARSDLFGSGPLADLRSYCTLPAINRSTRVGRPTGIRWFSRGPRGNSGEEVGQPRSILSM